MRMFTCRSERGLHVLGLVAPYMHSALLRELPNLKQLYAAALDHPAQRVQVLAGQVWVPGSECAALRLP